MAETAAPQFLKYTYFVASAWNFNGSVENEKTLKPLCLRVDELLGLPPRRIYRYFAAIDDPPFFQDDPLVRGFHVVFNREKLKKLPQYLVDCFYLPNREMGKLSVDAPIEQLAAFDDLIYLRHQTCLDSTGCVITYAHELQHAIQNYRHPKLVEKNTILRDNLRTYKPDATEIDIPAEVEANIVSKRIAEKVCGPASVEKFAKDQVALVRAGVLAGQAKRWKFFRKIPSSTEYDFVGATLGLVAEYQNRIDFGTHVDTSLKARNPAAQPPRCGPSKCF
jgi:hypothetical protein